MFPLKTGSVCASHIMYSIVGIYSLVKKGEITITCHEHFFEMEQDDE